MGKAQAGKSLVDQRVSERETPHCTLEFISIIGIHEHDYEIGAQMPIWFHDLIHHLRLIIPIAASQ